MKIINWKKKKKNDTSAALQTRLKFGRDWIFRILTNLPHGPNMMD